MADSDMLSARDFDPRSMDDDSDGDGEPESPEAGDLFDPDDGETFVFTLNVPLSMHRMGA